MNDFFNKMKGWLDKGIDVSQDALLKAGTKVQELGDKGVTKIELSRLEHQMKKEIAHLGLLVYDLFALQQKASVSAKNTDVVPLVAEITRLKAEIDKRSVKETGN
ncbi:hypothetical protein [Treponema lecithinolyticum]|jgi:hypothetical protein|uniref:Uncharacterized protein n=1 Tax=Treponema lecithinolyticum ATCC 700332 TaxID=1321815 RepID=A0ABN0NXU8_TRELE|nr:hypothetical protein [Treponema lecithinolyticum]ERJ92287.1 hypothetical protein HMPREF9193_01445 [Treponema lecithinolyticum ATCC 700332]